MRRFKIACAIAALMALVAPAQAADDLSRPIRVSPDGHFLTKPDGEPFFWLADTGWSLFTRLTREEADDYLRDRATKGFTVIQAVAAGSPLDDWDVPNRYGALPFKEEDPSQPNPVYFEHVDWVVKRAASYGLRMALLPVWGGSAIAGQFGKPQRLNAGNAEALGRWVASRYRGQGIVWVLGGDTNPVWAKNWQVAKDEQGQEKFIGDQTVVDYRPVYDAMANGIVAGEGGDPFITYHPTPLSPLGAALPLTSLFFADRSWLDMNMLQSGHTALSSGRYLGGDVIVRRQMRIFQYNTTYNYEPVSYEYHSSPTRPVVDGEPRFEDLAISLDETGSKGFWSGYDARNAAYHAVFAGAAGHTYGHHYVWQFYKSDGTAKNPSSVYELAPKRLDWREALERPAAAQMQHLKALMLSRPYFTRIPDQSLIAGDAGEGTAHISGTRDQQGDYAMIYLPHGQTVAVDFSKLSGSRMMAWWYDPRTGAATRVRNEIPRTGVRTFTPPTSGPENDWVLVLDNEAQSFPAPGTQPGER